MKINPINNSNQSFFFKPLKIVQSLAWVVVAILTLPTVIGPSFAWKKLAAIWNKNERSDTEKANKVASEALHIEDGFNLLDTIEQAPQGVHEYEQAITQFRAGGCLSATSAEAYLDYLRNDIKDRGGLDFLFTTTLLYDIGASSLDPYLQQITAKVTEAKGKERPLVFVPFLLAGNLVRERHIVVAVIDIAKQRIEYFDPKGNRNYSYLGKWADRNLDQYPISTQNFLKTLSRSAFPDKEKPDIIRNISGPQSLWNRVDCGAHVLDFIQTRIYTDAIGSDTPGYFETSLSSDGKQLREEMAITLQAKLDKKEDRVSSPVSYLKSLAQHSGLEASRQISIQDIPEEKDRIAIAEIAAQQNGKDASLLIKNYKIKTQAALVDIAKIVARQDARGLSQYIQNYGIKDKQALIEIAEVAAGQQNGGGVSYWIQQYIPDEKDRIAIAKIEAQQKEESVSSIQRKYAIKNQQALAEIAEILNKEVL